MPSKPIGLRAFEPPRRERLRIIWLGATRSLRFHARGVLMAKALAAVCLLSLLSFNEAWGARQKGCMKLERCRPSLDAFIDAIKASGACQRRCLKKNKSGSDCAVQCKDALKTTAKRQLSHSKCITGCAVELMRFSEDIDRHVRSLAKLRVPKWINQDKLGAYPTKCQNSGRARLLPRICGVILHEGQSVQGLLTNGRWKKKCISTHFAIERTGKIYYLKDILLEGGHAGRGDPGTIGIDLETTSAESLDRGKEHVTGCGQSKDSRWSDCTYDPRLIDSLRKLLRWLAEETGAGVRYQGASILGHIEVPSRTVHVDPRAFPWAELKLEKHKALMTRRVVHGNKKKEMEAVTIPLLDAWKEGRCN